MREQVDTDEMMAEMEKNNQKSDPLGVLQDHQKHASGPTKPSTPPKPTAPATTLPMTFDVNAIASQLMSMLGTEMNKLKTHMDDRTRQLEEAAKKQHEEDRANFEELMAVLSKEATGIPPVDNVKIPVSTDESTAKTFASTAKTYASTTGPGLDSPTRSKADSSKSPPHHENKAPSQPSPRKRQQQPGPSKPTKN
jgi:hypothetical protein